MFKSKKEVTTNSKVEKLSKDVLKNVLGGGDSGASEAPTPDPVDKFKAGAELAKTVNK